MFGRGMVGYSVNHCCLGFDRWEVGIIFVGYIVDYYSLRFGQRSGWYFCGLFQNLIFIFALSFLPCYVANVTVIIPMGYVANNCSRCVYDKCQTSCIQRDCKPSSTTLVLFFYLLNIVTKSYMYILWQVIMQLNIKLLSTHVVFYVSEKVHYE